MAQLDKGYYVDSQEGHGYSALSEAAVQGHTNVMHMLLEQGANPNLAGKDGRIALHRAAFKNSVTAVSLLLEAGSDASAVTSEGQRARDMATDPQVIALIDGWGVDDFERCWVERQQVMEVCQSFWAMPLVGSAYRYDCVAWSVWSLTNPYLLHAFQTCCNRPRCRSDFGQLLHGKNTQDTKSANNCWLLFLQTMRVHLVTCWSGCSTRRRMRQAGALVGMHKLEIAAAIPFWLLQPRKTPPTSSGVHHLINFFVLANAANAFC